MLKIKRNKNPELYQIFGIELANGKAWTIAHLYYLFESDGYYTITYGFFDVLEKELSDIKEKLDDIDLNNPVLVATVDVNPLKDWILLGKRQSRYINVDVENCLSKHGWYKSIDAGLYPKLECYFGIYPWDLIIGRTALKELTVGNKVSCYARYMKDFTRKEIEELNILSLVEYAGRLEELKE